MIKNYSLYLFFTRNLLTILLASSGILFSQPIVQTFTYTGALQTFTVPSCVSNISITVRGAQGGANTASTIAGGLGGQATGVLPVSVNDVLYIYVGGINGYNGGGSAGSSPCTG